MPWRAPASARRDSEDGELATFVVEDAGPPGTPLLAGAARRPDAGRSAPGERGGEGQGLALAQMRLAVEDGVLMVLGPEGDPVPPQAVVAALAPEPGGRLSLPDGASVPASRVVAALEAQRLGRLGRQETGEAWIMAMLRDDGWAEPASDRALLAERHDALPASPALEPRTEPDGGAAPTVEAAAKVEPADTAATRGARGPVPAAEDISREGRQVGEPDARVSPARAAAGAVVATGQRSDRARDRAAAQRGAAATSRLAWAPGDPSPTSAPVDPNPNPSPCAPCAARKRRRAVRGLMSRPSPIGWQRIARQRSRALRRSRMLPAACTSRQEAAPCSRRSIRTEWCWS